MNQPQLQPTLHPAQLCSLSLGLSVYLDSSILLSFFFYKISLRWTICKVFLQFLTTLLLFSFFFFLMLWFFWPQGMWDLSSLTLCTGSRSLNRWTATEVPPSCLLIPSEASDSSLYCSLPQPVSHHFLLWSSPITITIHLVQTKSLESPLLLSSPLCPLRDPSTSP